MQKFLLDADEVKMAIDKMAKEIIEQVSVLERLILVGIRTLGVPLALRIANKIEEKKGVKVPVGILDITLYRDDLSRLSEHPVIKKTEIPTSINSKMIFLVDDVLFTGRTVRAALDALFDFGRPDTVHLACLVDRGGRELPIQAEVIGIHYKAEANDNVKVSLVEQHGKDLVEVTKG